MLATTTIYSHDGPRKQNPNALLRQSALAKKHAKNRRPQRSFFGGKSLSGCMKCSIFEPRLAESLMFSFVATDDNVHLLLGAAAMDVGLDPSAGIAASKEVVARGDAVKPLLHTRADGIEGMMLLVFWMMCCRVTLRKKRLRRSKISKSCATF